MAIIFDNKSKNKKAKVASNHMYSGFWLDKDAWSLGDSFAGRGSNVIKALKLRKYQRGIANFVKILSEKDVPVIFKGTTSYTDNEHVVIATDISDKNFDVYAGLALHEASHLKYTDFEVLKQLICDQDQSPSRIQTVKEILNYVEDRRIDNLVFKSSPGYKAYYHKLYDHYFRTPDMLNMLQQYRNITWDSYMAQMIGMLHPKFNVNALPGLLEIAQLIDINNIDRLKNTADALEVAQLVYDVMQRHIEAAQQASMDNLLSPSKEENSEESQDSIKGGGKGEGQEEGGDGEGKEEGEEEGGDGEGEEEELTQLTPLQQRAMNEALREARSLVNGEVSKKQAAHSLVRKLSDITDVPLDYSVVGTEFKGKGFECLIHDATGQSADIAEVLHIESMSYIDRTPEQRDRLYHLRNKLPNSFCISDRKSRIDTMILEGFQLGANLGRKLLTRREERSLEQNRLRTGRIDAKRIAHAGYGIENIFNQIHIDKYKKANIHLTIDASGSMSGDRWDNSIKLAAALGKAVSMIDGLELQISLRGTDGNSPVVTIIYDSRRNKLQHLNLVLKASTCNSMTPEGLCLEALLNKKILIPTTAECDSYLINVCDGEPGHQGYYGEEAVRHTAKQVKRMNSELNIKHIGYFFGSSTMGSYQKFQRMYGTKQSIAIPNASNAMQIADHMNKQLMSK